MMEPIMLYANNGVAYVWNAQDWLKLRKEHRIIGHLTGTIASLPKQDTLPGLPLALLPEEVSLLIKLGISKLVLRKGLCEPPDQDIQEAYKSLREKLFEEQVLLLQNKRRDQIEITLEHIIEGKKRKLKSQGLDVKDEDFSKEMQMKNEIQKVGPIAKQHSLVEIFSEYPLQSSIEEFSVQDLTNYCPLREKVYEDLWHKGNYITGAEKFGGDFLLYPGDPIVFHSSHIINVVPSLATKFKMTEIVINGRLAVNVKKIAVYATEDSQGKIIYQTLSWKGC